MSLWCLGDTGASSDWGSFGDSDTFVAWVGETCCPWEDGGSDVSLGETRLRREEEGGDKWVVEVDASTSTELEGTWTCETWLFFLRTNACYAILLCLNLSSLSAIMHVIRSDKCHTITTSNPTNKKNKKMQTDKARRCIAGSWESKRWKITKMHLQIFLPLSFYSMALMQTTNNSKIMHCSLLLAMKHISHNVSTIKHA